MPEKGRVSFSDNDIKELFAFAEAAGFDIIDDYADAYAGHADKDLEIADYDDHPNQLAHRLLADRIYKTIKANDTKLSSGAPAQGQAAAVVPAP